MSTYSSVGQSVGLMSRRSAVRARRTHVYNMHVTHYNNKPKKLIVVVHSIMVS